jgi:hypothetical protein
MLRQVLQLCKRRALISGETVWLGYNPRLRPIQVGREYKRKASLQANSFKHF